jgi:hypothetical protein
MIAKLLVAASQSRLKIALVLVGFAVLLMSPAIVLGHIVGHSSALNVNWAEGFARQIALGNFYPRWLPDMTGGAGSPVFYFYGPLPFYVATPFVWVTANAALGVIFSSITLLIFSGLACFALCRFYASRYHALIASLIYIALPYHFDTDIWFRSALGEQAAFIFMPLAALCILKLADDNRYVVGLAFSFAGLIFSHLPSTLLFAPALIFLTLWTAWQSRSALVVWKSTCGALLGSGVSAIYVLPALSLQNLIQISNWFQHSPEENLLVTSEMASKFAIFLFPILAIACLFLALSILALRDNNAAQNSRPWIIIGTVVLLMTSILATPFWLHAGFYRIVQFPWRALSILDLCFAVLWANMWQSQQSGKETLAMFTRVIIVSSLFMAAKFQFQVYHAPADPYIMNITDERNDLRLKVDGAEYLPACYQPQNDDSQNLVTRAYAERNLKAVTTPGLLNVYYFPFLSIKMATRQISISCDPDTGFIKYDAPLSSSPIVITKEFLPAEMYGAQISLLSLATLIALVLMSKFRLATKSHSLTADRRN